MRVVVVTAPDPVVTWDDLDAHLRLSGDVTDKAYVEGLAAAATAHLDGPDGWLGRALGMQVLEARFDTFETTWELRLPCPPVVDLIAIGWKGADRQPRIGDLADVELIDTIVAAIGGTPPWSGMLVGREVLRVRYKAGYETIPAPIRAAILLMVDDLWNNRGTVETGARAAAVAIPMSVTVESLLAPYRVFG